MAVVQDLIQFGPFIPDHGSRIPAGELLVEEA